MTFHAANGARSIEALLVFTGRLSIANAAGLGERMIDRASLRGLWQRAAGSG